MVSYSFIVRSMHTWMPDVVWYGSRVVAFFLLMQSRRTLRRGYILRFAFRLVITFTFVRIRFIEPQQIALRETTIDLGLDQTAVLIADQHLGIFKDRVYLQRTVNTINSLSGIDMVLIAGDFTYNPDLKKLDELFQPLADLTVPVFAVLGNHDVEKPGLPVRDELIPVLEKYRVTVLNNDVIGFPNRYLVGLGDYDGGEDDVFLLNQFHVADTVVVLTHNPDTTLNYNNYNADLTLVGHTHCGQIRVPFLHDRLKKYIIPVEGDFDCGYTQTKYTQLFITPWLGEVILPLRRFNPPTIDIVHF